MCLGEIGAGGSGKGYQPGENMPHKAIFLVHCYKRNVTLLEMFGQEKYYL